MSTGTQQNNPWAKKNPNNSDFFQMITEQNMRDGMPKEAAESNAVREMQHYMKNGINPMGPINGREAGFNELKASQEANALAAQQADQQAAFPYNVTGADGKSFGNWQTEQNIAKQTAQAAKEAATAQQNTDFGKWMVEQQQAKQQEMAKQNIINKLQQAPMQNLQNLKIVHDPANFDLPTLK